MDRMGSIQGSSSTFDVTPHNSVPLTWQQEWAHSTWAPLMFPYVIPIALRIDGPLNLAVLEKSLRDLVNRHDALRARLTLQPGLNRQIIESKQFNLVIEESVATPEDMEREEQEFIRRMVLNTSDPTKTTFDAAVLKRTRDVALLVVAVNHMVFDGISIILFNDELWQLYAALAYDEALPPRAPGRLYSEYAVEQRMKEEEWRRRHYAYWQESLRYAKRVRLPSDRQQGESEARSFEDAHIDLGLHWTNGLQRLARENSISSAMTGLTLYAVLLARWCQVNDLVIPIAVSHRRARGESRTIGLMSGYLPLRIQLSNSQTFIKAAKETSVRFSAACDHVDCGRIACEYTEFFEGTAFGWFPAVKPGVPDYWRNNYGITSTVIHPTCFSEFRQSWKLPCDAFIEIFNTQHRAGAYIRYRSDLFTPEAIEKFLNELELLGNLVFNHQDISVASLLEASFERKLLRTSR